MFLYEAYITSHPVTMLVENTKQLCTLRTFGSLPQSRDGCLILV